MTKIKRKIIKIDEAKCNGCGQCVPSCKEGALQIIDGKARLVSEIYCDGLGACLGECPTGALTIEEREADEFDDEAVEEKVKEAHVQNPLPCGCPGSMAREISPRPSTASSNARQSSELRQWPVQLTLIPPAAPYLKNADLVLLADCTAYAYANVHQDFIRGRVVAIACPKLDDTEPYTEKLTHMIKTNNLRSIEVVMMEVPCCAGLARIAEEAIGASGISIALKQTTISLEGDIIKT